MSENTNVSNLRTEYQEYSADCEAALRITTARIKNIMEAYDRSLERNPFDAIESRIKTFESVDEKCHRKGYDLTIDAIKKNVLDVAGIRIITPFRDDIFTVAEMLHHIPGINIDDEKDYVSNPKPNGYSSYHLHVRVEIYSPLTNSSKLIPIEIQLRDKAMDMWATIEHIVRYKNDDPSPEATERFKRIADILVQFDEMAMELRDFNSNSLKSVL